MGEDIRATFPEYFTSCYQSRRPRWGTILEGRYNRCYSNNSIWHEFARLVYYYELMKDGMSSTGHLQEKDIGRVALLWGFDVGLRTTFPQQMIWLCPKSSVRSCRMQNMIRLSLLATWWKGGIIVKWCWSWIKIENICYFIYLISTWFGKCRCFQRCLGYLGFS